MTHTYDVVLDGQLGQRFGRLVWTECGGTVHGTFSLLGFENPVQGQRTGDLLDLTHLLHTAVSTLVCRTHAELCGDELTGVVVSARIRMDLRGKKQQEASEYEIPE